MFVCLQTAVPCIPAGVFSCPVVVSMRPVPAEKLDAAVEVSHLSPLAHGAPIHIGEPGTQTHILVLFIYVRTLVDIMYSLAHYPDLNLILT